MAILYISLMRSYSEDFFKRQVYVHIMIYIIIMICHSLRMLLKRLSDVLEESHLFLSLKNPQVLRTINVKIHTNE